MRTERRFQTKRTSPQSPNILCDFFQVSCQIELCNILCRPTWLYIHTYIHSFIHTYIHSFIHSFIHSYIHTFVHSYIPYISTSIRGLWCVFELAAYRKANPRGKITLRPLFMEQAVLILWILGIE